MPLPTGLVPVYAFVLTLGVSVPTTLVAVLFYRTSDASFAESLRTASLGAGSLYLVGVGVVWAVSGAGSLWGVAAALVATGAVAAVVLVAAPLAVGRRVFGYVRPADTEVALRYAAYGWPLAMLVVLGIFLAPGGVARGHLFDLGGPTACVAGFCGVPVSLMAAVAMQLVVAVFGPGLLGLLIHSSAAEVRTRRARS